MQMKGCSWEFILAFLAFMSLLTPSEALSLRNGGRDVQTGGRRGNTIKFLALFHPFRDLERFCCGSSRKGHQKNNSGFFQILKGSFLFSFLFVSWCLLVPWLMPKGMHVETQLNSLMPSIRSVLFSVVTIMTAGKSVKDICAGFVKVMYGGFWCETAVLAWTGIKDIFAGLIKILNALN